MLNKKIIWLFFLLGLKSSIYSQVLEDGTYLIKSKMSNECIQINKDVVNKKVFQAECNDSNSQQLTISHSGNDYYYIENLKVANNSTSNGINILQSTSGELFKIEKNGDYFSIFAKGTGKYITAKPFSQDIVQYNKYNTDAQLWDIMENNQSLSSCEKIKDANPNAESGTYTITINGSEYQVECEMTAENGTWTKISLNNLPINFTSSQWQWLGGSSNDYTYGLEKANSEYLTYGIPYTILKSLINSATTVKQIIKYSSNKKMISNDINEFAFAYSVDSIYDSTLRASYHKYYYDTRAAEVDNSLPSSMQITNYFDNGNEVVIESKALPIVNIYSYNTSYIINDSYLLIK
jgi:hypothetical protein